MSRRVSSGTRCRAAFAMPSLQPTLLRDATCARSANPRLPPLPYHLMVRMPRLTAPRRGRRRHREPAAGAKGGSWGSPPGSEKLTASTPHVRARPETGHGHAVYPALVVCVSAEVRGERRSTRGSKLPAGAAGGTARCRGKGGVWGVPLPAPCAPLPATAYSIKHIFIYNIHTGLDREGRQRSG